MLRGTEGSGAVMRLGAAAQEALWGAVAAGDVAGFRAALEAVRAVPTAVGAWEDGDGVGEGRLQGVQRGAGATAGGMEAEAGALPVFFPPQRAEWYLHSTGARVLLVPPANRLHTHPALPSPSAKASRPTSPCACCSGELAPPSPLPPPPLPAAPPPRSPRPPRPTPPRPPPPIRPP